jgi:hypothetical protein
MEKNAVKIHGKSSTLRQEENTIFYPEDGGIRLF